MLNSIKVVDTENKTTKALFLIQVQSNVKFLLTLDMNRSVYQRLKCVTHFLKPFASLNNSFSRYKYIACIANQSKFSKTKLEACDKYIFNDFRTVFSSSLQKSDGKSIDQSGEEPIKDVADDEEFQNILKDFAKDFDVKGENEKILDDIKKSLDDHDVNIEMHSSEAHGSASSKFGTQSAIDDKYNKFSDADSVVIPSYEDMRSDTYSEEEITYHINQDNEFDISQVQAKRK